MISKPKISYRALFYCLPILTGIFIGTSYIPFPPWAIFFAFIPLWYFWMETLERKESLKKIWWSGWICQFVLTLIGFNWVAHTIHEFGHMPLWAAHIALFGYCSFASLHVPIAGVLWFLVVRKFQIAPKAALFLLPAVTWLSETFYPMIFDWHFGYTWLWAGFPAFHLGEWIGFKGLSLITIFANLLLYFAVFNRVRTRLVMLASFAVAFLALNAIGMGLKQALPEYDKSAKVLVVQANIGNLEKQYAHQGIGFRDSILDRYIGLTEQGHMENPDVDFVMWPGTAFPDEFNRPGYFSKYVLRLRAFLDRTRLNLVTGSYGQLAGTQQTTNSMFFLYPRDSSVPEPREYNKTALLAFGEYVPGSTWFPVIKTWLPMVADFARGRGPEVKEYKGIHIGAQICYEGLFDGFTRKLSQSNAQVILNVTNDSWYGTWQEPYQHLYMTLARAIEIRRPLVRSTNTGISTLMLAHGEVLEKSPLETAWQGSFKVPYWSEGPKTLFSRWGYWLPVVFALGWLVFWLSKALRARPRG